MNDLLVVFSLIIGSVLFFLVMTVVLIYKSFLLSKYAKGKNKKIYKKVHGIVSEGPFAVPLYNNFAYWRWVFKNERNEDKELRSRKVSLRKTFFIFLIPLLVILVCSIYLLYLR